MSTSSEGGIASQLKGAIAKVVHPNKGTHSDEAVTQLPSEAAGARSIQTTSGPGAGVGAGGTGNPMRGTGLTDEDAATVAAAQRGHAGAPAERDSTLPGGHTGAGEGMPGGPGSVGAAVAGGAPAGPGMVGGGVM